MNFIVELPKTQSKFDNIMVVVHKLTKIANFIHTVSTITAYEVVELLMREIFRYHRISREIISDRDRKFATEFWTTLFKLCGTKIKLSTAYHHETDGQTRPTNKILENMLRMYIGKKQHS